MAAYVQKVLLTDPSNYTNLQVGGSYINDNFTALFGAMAVDGGTYEVTYFNNVNLSDGKIDITETTNDIPLKINANFATQTNAILYLNVARAATDAFEFIRGYANSVERFRINGLGNMLNTNNSYGALSDIKLKTNLRPASIQWEDIKAIASIMQNYQLKAEYALDPNSKFHLGVVAQDLQLISPSLVSASPDKEVIIVQEAVAEVKDANGIITTQAVEEITETRIVLDAEGKEIVTLGVNYSLIYLKAVKALGEAMERIEVLEAKVEALETP
jgi:hypothetical protein